MLNRAPARAALAAALILWLLAHAAPADTIRVANTTELLQAVPAAPPGSEVVLAPGTYTGPFVLQKSLHVRAEEPGSVTVTAPGDDYILLVADAGEFSAAPPPTLPRRE